MKVHLVDGTYELFRAYYGPPGSTHDGREVGATRAFFRSMLFLLKGAHKEEGGAYIAAAFDTQIESFRNGLFDGYKTGAGIEPDLLGQFPLAELVSTALGFRTWAMVDFEADDGIATGAFHYRQDPRVTQVLLCSPDKDLYQCVDDEKVTLWDRMRNKKLGRSAVIDKMGVPPERIADYLALVGDSADGIPGIAKWGAKSTAALLNAYGPLENIPDDETTWSLKVRGAKGLAENLRAGRQNALLYKTLATLRTDAVPTDTNVDTLKWQGGNQDALNELASICGDDSMRDIGLTPES